MYPIIAAIVELFPLPVIPVPPLVLGDLLEHRREFEVGKGRNLDRDDPHDDPENAALLQDIDAEGPRNSRSP
jgi:hypothetical protein